MREDVVVAARLLDARQGLRRAGIGRDALRPGLLDVLPVAGDRRLLCAEVLEGLRKAHGHLRADLLAAGFLSRVRQRALQAARHERIGVEQRPVKVPDDLHAASPLSLKDTASRGPCKSGKFPVY